MSKNKILQIFLTLIFTPILLFFVILIILLFVLPLLVYRALILVFAKCFKSQDLRQMVNSISSIMGAEDMTGINSLTSFAALELSTPIPNLEFISNLVQKNGLGAINPKTGCLLYPELKECVKSWMGFLFWARPKSDFNIQNHVYNLEDLKIEQRDWNTDPRALQNCIMELIRNKVWVEGQPFWEFIIISSIPIHLLGPDAVTKCNESHGSIILFRMHHILGDGFCIFKFLTQVFEFSDIIQNVTKPKVYTNKEIGGCREKLWQKMIFMFRIPFDILEEIFRACKKPDKIPKMQEEPGLGSRLIGVVSNDVPLSKIKTAKNIYKVDFTSIFLAMFAGGCRRFLSKIETSKLPQEVEVAFPLLMPKHPDTLTNHISQASLRLPIAESDIIKRLILINDRVSALKKSTLPWTTFCIMRLLGVLPIFLSKWVRQASDYGPGLIFTNLLGPSETVYVGEFPVLGLRVGTNSPIDAPLGYCLMVISYNGNARLTVGSMNNYLSSHEDAEELLKSCLEELDALLRDELV